MRHYQKKINELGIDNSKLSKGLKTQVQDILGAENELRELNEKLAEMDSEDEGYEELQGEIEELSAAIEDVDNDLVAAIDDWWAKREIMVERGKHMQQAKKAKQAAAAGQNAPANAPEPTPIPSPSPAPIVAPQVNVQYQPQPVNIGQPVIVTEQKKKGGSWLLWGGLAVLGLLVGVNVMRNKD